MATDVGEGLENRGRRIGRKASTEPVTEEQLLGGLHLWLQTEDVLEAAIGRLVAMLRCYGRSWAYVGQVVGMTAEGARRRFESVCDEHGVPRRVSSDAVAILVAGLPPADAALSLSGGA